MFKEHDLIGTSLNDCNGDLFCQRIITRGKRQLTGCNITV